MKFPSSYTREERLAARFLERMASGDVDGLTCLYGLYQAPLMSFILAIVKEKGAAEEVFQDVFVRAFKQAEQFDPERGTPFVWLATIARRKAIDWLRKRDRRPQFVATETEQAENFADKDDKHDPFGVRNQLEAHLVLERFPELPQRERQALELAFLRGYTQQEIADALDLPLGTVKSDLRRGVIRLRKIYLGEDD